MSVSKTKIGPEGQVVVRGTGIMGWVGNKHLANDDKATINMIVGYEKREPCWDYDARMCELKIGSLAVNRFLTRLERHLSTESGGSKLFGSYILTEEQRIEIENRVGNMLNSALEEIVKETWKVATNVEHHRMLRKVEKLVGDLG